jgi:hypothetical protein
MGLVGFGLWAVLILLLMLDAAVIVAVAQHIEAFGLPLPWRLSASAAALLAITVAGVLAGGPELATSPGSQPIPPALGFGPGWYCPNLGKASAMVCFADAPVTSLQQSGAGPTGIGAEAGSRP